MANTINYLKVKDSNNNITDNVPIGSNAKDVTYLNTTVAYQLDKITNLTNDNNTDLNKKTQEIADALNKLKVIENELRVIKGNINIADPDAEIVKARIDYIGNSYESLADAIHAQINKVIGILEDLGLYEYVISKSDDVQTITVTDNTQDYKFLLNLIKEVQGWIDGDGNLGKGGYSSDEYYHIILYPTSLLYGQKISINYDQLVPIYGGMSSNYYDIIFLDKNNTRIKAGAPFIAYDTGQVTLPVTYEIPENTVKIIINLTAAYEDSYSQSGYISEDANILLRNRHCTIQLLSPIGNEVTDKYIYPLLKNNPSGTGSLSMNRNPLNAFGDKSSALGDSCSAEGAGSLATGINTIAKDDGAFVSGQYNTFEEGYAAMVGNGSAATGRSNAYTLDWDGNAYFAGDIKFTDSNGNIISLREQLGL